MDLRVPMTKANGTMHFKCFQFATRAGEGMRHKGHNGVRGTGVERGHCEGTGHANDNANTDKSRAQASAGSSRQRRVER